MSARQPHIADHVDPRSIRSRERAIEAVRALLRADGVRAVNFESVAAHSGLAKTTLYRQFTDREEMIFATFESMAGPKPIGAAGTVVDDVHAWMQSFARGLRGADFAEIVPALIDAAERSDRGRLLAARFTARRRALLQQRLKIAIAEGELPDSVDLDLLASQLVGPLFYRRYISRQPLGRAFITHLVHSTLTAAACREISPGRVLCVSPVGGEQLR